MCFTHPFTITKVIFIIFLEGNNKSLIKDTLISNNEKTVNAAVKNIFSFSVRIVIVLCAFISLLNYQEDRKLGGKRKRKEKKSQVKKRKE